MLEVGYFEVLMLAYLNYGFSVVIFCHSSVSLVCNAEISFEVLAWLVVDEISVRSLNPQDIDEIMSALGSTIRLIVIDDTISYHAFSCK